MFSSVSGTVTSSSSGVYSTISCVWVRMWATSDFTFSLSHWKCPKNDKTVKWVNRLSLNLLLAIRCDDLKRILVYGIQRSMKWGVCGSTVMSLNSRLFDSEIWVVYVFRSECYFSSFWQYPTDSLRGSAKSSKHSSKWSSKDLVLVKWKLHHHKSWQQVEYAVLQNLRLQCCIKY